MDRILLMPCIDGVLQVGVAHTIRRVQWKDVSIGLMDMPNNTPSVNQPSSPHEGTLRGH